MTSTLTPEYILSLAREAAKWNRVFTNPPSDAERAWYRLTHECGPAIIIALCERLEYFAECVNTHHPAFTSAKEQAMLTPLFLPQKCPTCGVYPAEDGGECPGCEAYREHQA